MNRTATVAVLFGSVVTLLAIPAGAQVRTWTDSSGSYKIEAEFVDESDGTVRLKRSDGRIVSLPLERLSAADQAYVQKQPTTTEVPAETPDPLAPSANTVTMELLSGAQVTGRITAKDDQSVTIEAAVGGRTFTRKYPLDRIRAVVTGEQRVVAERILRRISPVGHGQSRQARHPPAALPKRNPSSGRFDQAGVRDGRRAQPGRDRETDRRDGPFAARLVGRDAAELPADARPVLAGEDERHQNPQKNMSGSTCGDIIHPNESKWHEGIRLVHFLLEQHQGDRGEVRHGDMVTLGRLYYLLLQDYARAAFWWRKAGVERSPNQPIGVYLADCYWRLGSKPMALEYLNRMGAYRRTDHGHQAVGRHGRDPRRDPDWPRPPPAAAMPTSRTLRRRRLPHRGPVRAGDPVLREGPENRTARQRGRSQAHPTRPGTRADQHRGHPRV